MVGSAWVSSEVKQGLRSGVAALYLGTGMACVVVGEVDDGGVAVAGVGTAPSRGLRKGVIVDVESTVAAIQSATWRYKGHDSRLP